MSSTLLSGGPERHWFANQLCQELRCCQPMAAGTSPAPAPIGPTPTFSIHTWDSIPTTAFRLRGFDWDFVPTRVKTCSHAWGQLKPILKKCHWTQPWSTLKLVDQYVGASFLWLAPLLYPHKSVQQRLKVIHTTILVQALNLYVPETSEKEAHQLHRLRRHVAKSWAQHVSKKGNWTAQQLHRYWSFFGHICRQDFPCFPPCKGHATSSSSKTQQWISTAWAVAHPTRPLAKLLGCTRTWWWLLVPGPRHRTLEGSQSQLFVLDGPTPSKHKTRDASQQPLGVQRQPASAASQLAPHPGADCSSWRRGSSRTTRLARHRPRLLHHHAKGLAPGSCWCWSSSPRFPGSWNYNPYAIQTLRATACRWSGHYLGPSYRWSSKIPSPSLWRTDSLVPNVSHQPGRCSYYCAATIPRSCNMTSFTCEWPFSPFLRQQDPLLYVRANPSDAPAKKTS